MIEKIGAIAIVLLAVFASQIDAYFCERRGGISVWDQSGHKCRE